MHVWFSYNSIPIHSVHCPPLSDKGLGYYNMKSHKSIDVLLDRCQRKMCRLMKELCGYSLWIFAIQVVFWVDVADDGVDASVGSEAWLFFIVFGCIVLPILFYVVNKELCRWAKIHQDVKFYSNANAMERGRYTLHGEIPDARDLAGAAACGFSVIYRYVQQLIQAPSTKSGSSHSGNKIFLRRYNIVYS